MESQLVLSKEQPLGLDQLTTSDLQLLASANGHRHAEQSDRAAVLSFNDKRLRVGPKVWLVENAQVVYRSQTMR